MGCGGSTNQQGTAATKNINKAIHEKIMAQRSQESEAIKVLLLGAGECGKSTILKQMKILHMDGFDPAELASAKKLVFKNTLDAIQSIVNFCREASIPYETDGCEAAAERIAQMDSSMDVPLSTSVDLKLLWADVGIQNAVKREAEFHLIDSCKYFMDRVEANFTQEFEPSVQDMLRSRLTTTGIIETMFKLDDMTFKMYDVGGQRGERKKWIHCFDDVTAIMYIASLSEYNQVLAEDRTKNRLEESLTLFEGIANLPWFEKASIILFLNKNDLFEMKVVKHDIGDWHSEYTGGLNYDAGIEWIKGEYVDRNEDEDKELYTHVTDATNTENVEFVWTSTQEIILKGKLADCGMAM